MRKTRFLTDEEKKQGAQVLSQFQGLNGIGYSLLGDTPVYLLAIMYGATNVQLGYISSAAFIAGVLLPVLPRLLKGKNIISVLSISWLIRGLICIGYLGLYLLSDQAAVYLILGLYTAFSIIRTAGVVMFKPIIRMITTSTNQGAVFGKINMSFQVASIFSKAISFLVTSLQQLSGLLGIISLQMGGVLVNTLAAIRIRRTPCRETVSYQRGRGVFTLLKESLQQKDLRKVVILQWLSTAVFVLFNLSVPFVRSRIDFSTSEVFLYSLTLTSSAIVSSLLVRTFSDAVGSKPLMIMTTLLATVLMLLWFVVPESFSKLAFYILGFISMIVVSGNNMLINKLSIKYMPEDDQVSFSSMLNFVIAVISFTLGLLGGRLIDFGPVGTRIVCNQYSWTFLLNAGLSLAALILALRVKEGGSLSNRDAAAMFLSAYGIRAFLDISRLQKTDDPMKKRTVLLSLGRNSNDVATSEIERVMHSPFAAEKAEFIRSLFYNPRPSLLPLLLDDAADNDSYTRYDSLFALGSYPDRASEELLIPMLESPDGRLQAAAAKSLGRIGNSDYLDTVVQLWQEEREISNLLNYIIALYNMDGEGRYLERLFREGTHLLSGRGQQSRYALHADLLQFEPKLSLLYQQGNIQRGDGLKDFLDEARDQPDFLSRHDELIAWFEDEDFHAIRSFCSDTVTRNQRQPVEDPQLHHKRHIGASIIRCCSEEYAFNYSDALAVLYFTYQVVRPLN